MLEWGGSRPSNLAFGQPYFARQDLGLIFNKISMGDSGEKKIIIIVVAAVILTVVGFFIASQNPATFSSEEKKESSFSAAAIISVIDRLLGSTTEENDNSEESSNPPQTKNGTGTETKKPSSGNSYNGGSSYGGSYQTQSKETATTSRYYGMIKINRGTAASEKYNPNKEYITLTANSTNKETINITGWTLKNGNDEKFYPVNDSVIRGVAAYVKIPLGTNLLYGDRASIPSPIILNPGGKATIVSGRIGNISPIYVDMSFRVNKCSGYIENMDSYDFYPRLTTSCPVYKDLPFTDVLDDKCYDFIKQISRCGVPKFERNDDGYDTVNGKIVSSYCRNYIKTHYSYNACVSEFSSDTDFYTNEWRVFLNSPLLWADRNETITLYDNLGKVVATTSY